MDATRYWQNKLVQWFHDPPGKPFAAYSRVGGHRKLGKDLFAKFLPPNELKYYPLRPDLATAGADRPVLTIAGRPKGVAPINVHYWKAPHLTHPLARALLKASHIGSEELLDYRDILEEVEDQERVVETLRALGDVGFSNIDEARRGFRRLWRRMRDELTTGSLESDAKHPKYDLLWERMPADTRCPDHSIWEHLKVTAALAFLDTPLPRRDKFGSGLVPDEKQPYLFTFSIDPVQAFIRQSRTSRDLWISSFIVSDLAWHAMLPIVEHYGPDNIVYPDLLGNPRADIWLDRLADDPEVLPEITRSRLGTYAAVIPNTFTAILPRGGAGHLKPLSDIAKECEDRLQKRWKELADVVWNRLNKRPEWTKANLRAVWDNQVADVFSCIWNAVEWTLPEKLSDTFFSKQWVGALPAQEPEKRVSPSFEDSAAIEARAQRLRNWMEPETWAHYEVARKVFGALHKGYIQTERGFDYATTQHQLRVRHHIRKRAHFPKCGPSGAAADSGEKCTLCRERNALAPVLSPTGDSDMEPIDQDRHGARGFWGKLDKDRLGAERLCAVCTIRRFLVESDEDHEVINHVWSGPPATRESSGDDESTSEEQSKVRVPFPSTVAIAAQDYLVELFKDSELEAELWAVVEAYRKCGLPRTAFARSFRRLAHAARSSAIAREFLKLDTEQALFPEIVEAEMEAARPKNRKDAEGESEKEARKSRLYRELLKAVQRLRQKADRSLGMKPSTRFAVIRMDGDSMGRLLLGDADRIGARWRDVIHPKVVERIEKAEANPDPEYSPETGPHYDPQLFASGWKGLLDHKRLMGPSLQAFISRALADFSHTIAPWVIEQEFSGRLIYSGGDDILALAPADEALAIAARLQQLFSVAWVIDTAPNTDPWGWRKTADSAKTDSERRRRFVIPIAGSEPVDPFDASYAGFEGWEEPPPRQNGRILAMLGPAASLSAGVVYAHFKTPLRPLMDHAAELLNSAKNDSRRRSVGLAHYSRNGVKSRIVLPWEFPSETAGSVARGAHSVMETIRGAFQNGFLPGRLPYKLREMAPTATVVLEGLQDAASRYQALAGFIRQGLDGGGTQELIGAVAQVWDRGFVYHGRERGGASGSGGDSLETAKRSVEGLLLCRSLSRNDDMEDDV